MIVTAGTDVLSLRKRTTRVFVLELVSHVSSLGRFFDSPDHTRYGGISRYVQCQCPVSGRQHDAVAKVGGVVDASDSQEGCLGYDRT